MLEVRRLASATIAAAMLAACSGGDDGGTEPTPTIDIALSNAALTIVQGTNQTTTVTLTRSGGFTGDVAVTVEGLPTGVTASAAPATLGASVTSSVVTFTASATAATGAATATIRASGNGVTAKTATVALTVNAAPSYSLAAAAASVAQGGTGNSNITITRTGGFAGAVTLSAEGLPTGVTAAFAPNNTTTNASVLTLTAAAGATTGVSTVTVRGTATGQTDKTATFQLTVTATGGGGSFTLAVGQTTVTGPQGGTGTANITITREGGFAGVVTLAAENLPTGVTAAFNPAAIPATGTTSVLTLTVAGTAPVNSATILVRGTSPGQQDKSATFLFTVTASTAGYTLAVTPTTVPVTQGATANATVAINRTNNFAGQVSLSATGLPTGVTATFQPSITTGNTSTVTFTATGSATLGNATVTIRGNTDGLSEQTATLTLTVAAAAGGFTLSMGSPTTTLQQGTSGNATVNINRTNNFAGTVNLTVTGLPTGVTGTFTPAAATGNTSTLALTATGTATVGQATVTVRGNSGTLAEQTATFTLNVTQATGGSGNTVFEFCAVGNTPLWFAVQDGATGTWTRVTPSGTNNTRFQFNITQARAGIAYVIGTTSGFVGSAARGTLAARISADMERELLLRNRPSRTSAFAARSAVDGFALSVIYGTQLELSGTGGALCLPGTGKTVNGTVANVGQTQSASITLGSSSAGASGANTSFVLEDVPDGALDLIAARTTTTISGTSFSIALDKLIIRRGVNAANNSTLPVLDFGAAEAFDPVQANITLGNIGTDVGFALTSYFTSAGSSVTGATLAGFSLPGAGPFKYYGVPTNRQVAGDLHVAIGFAFPSLTSTDQSRFAALYFKDPTDRTVTLGPALTAPTVSTAATAPYVRFRATGPVQTQYNKLVSVSFTQGGTAPRSASIQASEGYLAGSANYDFTIPDFTAVAGWDNNWGPKTGVQTTWSVTAYTFAGIGLGSLTPLEGSTFTGASRTGTITP